MTEYDASNRKDIRRAEKQAKLEEQQRQEIVTNLMSTTPGRAYVLEQLERAHLFTTSFNVDPTLMAFNEGERNAGLQLLNDIMRACPDNYVLMMKERNEKELTNAARSRSDQRDPDGDGGDADPDDGANE